MFENKVLVNIYILSIGEFCEMYIPVNEKIGNISKLLNQSLFEEIDTSKNYTILNIEDGSQYESNKLVRNTNIKNGTKLVLI